MPPQADLNLTYNLVPSPQVPQQIRNIERGLLRDNYSAPLGRISASFSQFDKSLDASNARVLAFGASAGLILGVQRAFSSLVRETIGVEKALTDINAILGLSTKSLTSFGSQLFDIAKNTGQSFAVVADAAKELSRQGLSASETLKRTQDALILTRQSGLDAEDSVKAITSALNSFQKEVLTSTSVINKLANVDANFAVSSRDLANAITRTGSAAESAGVKFDELIGLVTAAQQITQRGGTVIAQALNSVFARISRPGVLDQLKELGVQIDGSQTGIEKLKALSEAISNASQEQAAMIKDAAGGVRNLNVLSAVLGDLGNKYSFVKRATEESNQASDQAIQRNDQLNKTYAALTNRTIANIQQVGAQFGKLTIGPGLENVLGKINSVLEGSISKDSDSMGEILGKGILKGLGEFLGGPGIILITAVIGKLILRLASESASALKTILGINKAATDRAAIEATTNSILQSQPDLVRRVLTNEEQLLGVVKQVNLSLSQRQELLEASNLVVNRAIGRSRPKAAVGLIPQIEEKMGAYAGGYTPGQVKETSIPGIGNVVYNSAEKIRSFPGLSQPAIIPPQGSRAGQNYLKDFQSAHGFNPYKSEGLVPNYASNLNVADLFYKNYNFTYSGLDEYQKYLPGEYKKYLKAIEQPHVKDLLKRGEILVGEEGFPQPFFKNVSRYTEGTLKNKSLTKNDIFNHAYFSPDSRRTFGYNPQATVLSGLIRGKSDEFTLGKQIGRLNDASFFQNSEIKDLNRYGLKGLFGEMDGYDQFPELVLKDAAENFLQYSAVRYNKNPFNKNIFRNRGLVPNFSPISDAIAREASAGIPAERIKVGASPLIRSALNPAGLGVYNTKDEPGGLHQGILRAQSEGKNPKTYGVPNFAPPNINYEGLPGGNLRSIYNSQFANIGQLLDQNKISLKEALDQLKSFGKIAQVSSSSLENLDKYLTKIYSKRENIPITATQAALNRYNNFQQGQLISQLSPEQKKLIIDTVKSVNFGKVYSRNITDINRLLENPEDRRNRTEDNIKRILKSDSFVRANGTIAEFNKPEYSSPFLNPDGSKRRVIQLPGPLDSEFEQRRIRNQARSFRFTEYNGRTYKSGFDFPEGALNTKKLSEEQEQKGQERRSAIYQRTQIPNHRLPFSSYFNEYNQGFLQDTIARRRLQKLNEGVISEQNGKKYDLSYETLKRYSEQSSLGYSLNQPRPLSLLQKLKSFKDSPKLQNAAIAASFILPIAGSTIAEYTGDKNTRQRGLGQTAQSLANIGSYAALGSTFGAQGAIIGAGAGALLETPKIIKAFTDTIPDLEREIETLTTKLSQVNEGFSDIIVTGEKLKQYQRGELNLSPLQYGNLKSSQKIQISTLAGLFPEHATEIRKAGISGNIEDIEKLQEKIAPKIRQQITLDKISTLQSENNLTSQSSYGLSRLFKGIDQKGLEKFTSAITLAPSVDEKNPQTIQDFLLNNAKTNKKDNYLSKLESSFKLLDRSDVIGTSASLPGGSNDLYNELREKQQTILEKFNKNIIEQLNGIKDTGKFPQINTYISSLKSASLGSDAYHQLISDLRKNINIPSLKESLNLPEVDIRSRTKEYTNFLKSLSDLSSQLELFTGKLEVITSHELNQIQSNLSVKLSGIQTRTAIGSLRNQYSPYTALNIENQGALQEIGTNESSQIESAQIGFNKQQIERPALLIKGIDDIIRKKITSRPNQSFINISEEYQKEFSDSLKNILPNSQEYLGGNNSKEAISTFLNSANSSDIKEFYKNLSKERDRLYNNIGSADPNQVKILSDIGDLYTKILDAQGVDVFNYQKTLEEISNKSNALKDIQKNQNSLKRAQIIESVTSSYADITSNLKDVREIVNQTESNITVKRLKGVNAIRERNFENTNGILPIGVRDYKNNQITTEEYRNRYLLPKANAEFEQNGRVSGATNKDIVFSAFKFTPRDQNKELLEDVKGLADALASIRPLAKDAFASIITGSKSAGDAFGQLGISIATNILNNIARISFDQLAGSIGSLFGGGKGSAFTGILSNIFGGSPGHAAGGLITYANGGPVNGGSGIRDDVPAMLSNGSFVIKKSSANKYGMGALNAINYGKGFDKGGGVHRLLTNDYVLSGRKESLKGKFNVDSALSIVGQTDENNPHNAVKFGMEQDYISYLGTIKQYKEAMKQYEAAKLQRIIGAYVSAGIQIAGGAFGGKGGVGSNAKGGAGYDFNGFQNTYSNVAALGGLATPQGIRRYNNGGSVDNIPALLTGGEYVMNPEAVNRMGVGYMNRLNSGGITSPGRYATGGLVGRDINSINPVVQQNSSDNGSQIAAALLELVKINKEMRDIQTGAKQTGKDGEKGNRGNNNDNTGSSAPQVNITINMTNTSTTSSNSKESNTDTPNGQNVKELSKLIETQVLSTIVSQQRDGGLLSNTRRGK